MNVSYEDVRRTSDGEDWLLEIGQAKDTTGEYNGGKQRDVWLPRNVAIDMLEHIHDEDKDKSEPIITVSSKRTVQKWIEEVRNELAEETGNEQWQYVSSHDFRRSLASHMLHEESVQLLVVKEHFGWQSIDTVRSYLDSPSESVMQREFRDVDF